MTRSSDKPRSFMAHFVNVYFTLKHKLTEEEAEADLKKIAKKGEMPSPVPKGLDVIYEDNVFWVNKGSSSDRTVFYIHGGGFQHDFSPFHWKFIRKVVERTDAEVIAPAYHLIPFGTCKDAFDLIVPLYQKYCEDHPGKKIIVMGDSAGGGIALALTEHFKAEGLRIPDETILLSPFVDATLENPDIAKYTGKDPWLSVPWARVCVRHWKGSYSVDDYRVSPIFGDVSGLKNITVFSGTREVLYPDIVKMYERLDKEGNELVIGQGMLHVYPLLPIPEAERYREKIYETIRR